MKQLLILLLLLPFGAAGQVDKVLTLDSLKKHYSIDLTVKKQWKFKAVDSPAMAEQNYNDSAWQTVSPLFLIDPGYNERYNSFSGVGWFRFHFVTDSSLNGEPLAFVLAHLGASEIYLDGKQIAHFGKINGKDSSVYVNPQNMPSALVIPNAGKHVLAIRYANYAAQRNYKIFNQPFSGFTMSIGRANTLIYSAVAQYETTGFYTVLLAAIFLTLFILHLLLYLFYRSDKSNLYFSLFCFSLSMLFWCGYINEFGKTPEAAKYVGYGLVLSICLLIGSLSGFNNELFSRKKLRFRIVASLCVLNAILCFVAEDASGYMFIGMGIFVLVEALVLTIAGIVKKVRGARIIGAGMLIFAIFLLFIFALGIFNHGLEFSGNSGQIFLNVAFFAVLSLPASMSIYLSHHISTLNRDLRRHLLQVEELSAQAIEQEKERKRILESQNEMLEKEVAARTQEVLHQKDEIEQQNDELKKEKKKSDDLLLNILPAEVAEELKEKGTSKAKLFEKVTVLFTDFVGFTTAGERMPPEELVSELDTCFKAFDEIISRHNIEKIKTIGDAYLAISGLPEPVADHAGNVAKAALEITRFMAERRRQLGERTFEIRVGIHSGSVVAGIVGVKKFAYDIWGDTVNTAARMQQHSEPGRINISQTTYELLQHVFKCTYRGKIEAKNKGELNMYFIESAGN